MNVASSVLDVVVDNIFPSGPHKLLEVSRSMRDKICKGDHSRVGNCPDWFWVRDKQCYSCVGGNYVGDDGVIVAYDQWLGDDQEYPEFKYEIGDIVNWVKRNDIVKAKIEAKLLYVSKVDVKFVNIPLEIEKLMPGFQVGIREQEVSGDLEDRWHVVINYLEDYIRKGELELKYRISYPVDVLYPIYEDVNADELISSSWP